MPAHVPPVADEREGLLEYLSHQRLKLKVTAHGLTDEQARLTPSASELSVGALIKHVAATEQSWIDIATGRPPQASQNSQEDYVAGMTMTAQETLDGLIARYDEVAAETAAALANIDLAQPVPVPRDAPWFPHDVEAWSVRWVILHLIQETARHGGHADIIRETIDGGTFYALQAAAEGWPETDWLKPWSPPTTQ